MNMNQFDPSFKSTEVGKFEFVKRFDELNHKAVLLTLASSNLDDAYDAFIGTSNPFVLVEPVPEWMTDVMGFIAAGQKVSAVKRIREGTGLGLKESKWVFDTLTNAEFREALNDLELSKYNLFVQRGLALPYVAPVTVPPVVPKAIPMEMWIGSCLKPDAVRSMFTDEADFENVRNWHHFYVGTFHTAREAWDAVHRETPNGELGRYGTVHSVTI